MIHKHTIGVRQECLLSPNLFNVYLERIMTDALEDHEGTAGIGGRTITCLRFADDIDVLAGEEEELAKLVERLDKASTAHGMEIGAEKTKLMTNNTSGMNTEIKVNGQKLETVTSLKYLGSAVSEKVETNLERQEHFSLASLWLCVLLRVIQAGRYKLYQSETEAVIFFSTE